MSRRIQILFNTWANANNVNSQSLTAREIARRLDPERFVCALFIGNRQTIDSNLAARPNIKILRVPPRLGSFYIAAQMLWGAHDILFYPSLNRRASRWFWRFRKMGRRKRIISNMEASLAQMQAAVPQNYAFELYSLKHSDRCFAITPAIARSFWEAFQVHADVIPLGVDLELFRPVDRSARTGVVRVLFVATLQPRKQPHVLLDMARALANEPVEFHLIGPVIGDSKYAEQLYADAERDNLTNVFFHGALPPSRVCEWMQASDIFILPSRLEGFGKVMIEAGATGLPSIIFSDYQSTTVIDSVTGYQVETDSQMLGALRELIQNRERRLQMGIAATEHAKLFSWDTIVRQWEEVFENMF